MNILLIDDDKTVLDSTKEYLEHYNFFVQTAQNTAEARRIVAEQEPDLIVLDVMMSDGDGYDFCKKLKLTANIPVIFISSLAGEENRVDGFLSGGDDYLVKPFSFHELRLRILARARSEKDIRSYHLNGIVIQNGFLIGDTERVALTAKELEILLLLWRNRGNSIGTQEIYNYVWGLPDNNDARTVKFHMHNLRKKLRQVYPQKEYIKTQWGNGYVFE